MLSLALHRERQYHLQCIHRSHNWLLRHVHNIAAAKQEATKSDAELSTTQRGAAFEERAMALLQGLSMSLRRVGGKGDEGVDLLGWWWLPRPNAAASSVISSSSKQKLGDEFRPTSRASVIKLTTLDSHGVQRSRVRVLVQCKAEVRRLGPKYVREMEGVVHRHFNDATPSEPAVGVLVSESSFTQAALTRAMSSSLPLLLLHISPVSPAKPGVTTEESESALVSLKESTRPSVFSSAFWNRALSGHVLGERADIRWELSSSIEDLAATNGRGWLSLWHEGKRLESWMPPSERSLA